MADIMSREKRSKLMARIRGENTTPERRIRVLLAALGLDFEEHAREIAGRPDFIFRREKVAVFINGDFWHGWRFPIWQHKLSPFWRRKIAGNRSRDERNARRLRRLGWRPMKIWEHQVEEDAMACVHRIASAAGGNDLDWDAVRQAQESLPPLRRRDRLPKP